MFVAPAVNNGCHFGYHFLTARHQFVENKISCRIKFILLLCYRIIALGQPLWMADHALDWGDSLNQCRGGGQHYTMVMMLVGGVVSVCDRIPVLFLL